MAFSTNGGARRAWIVIWALGLWACDDGPGPGTPCTTPAVCPIVETCVDGLCAPLDLTDRDGDGVPDDVERSAGTDPAAADTDRDGASDNEELGYREGTRLYDGPDTDGDGRIDALESSIADADGDGLPDQRDPCDDDPDCPEAQTPPCAADEGDPCVVGIGACEAIGVTVCADDGEAVDCAGEPGPPVDELCSGIDDDCDGLVDEGFDGLDTPCEVGVGRCAATGRTACGPDGVTVVCGAEAGAPLDERCNGLDDDCDGATDEDFPDVGFVCERGLGACNTAGVFACSASGLSVVCEAEGAEPVDEVCNGVDDDCDGRIDEAFANVGQRCTAGLGGCRGEGVFRCTDDGLATACTAAERAPSDELCNGVDDDCDGITDEGFDRVGEPCESGVGACARAGELACDPALEDYACDAAPGAPGDETCNGEDDDCDGATDEGFGVGDACAAGIGACRAEGVIACDPFRDEPACSARPGLAIDELCNGRDDDCDGATDEGFADLGDPCSAGIGACRVEGEIVCTQNQRATRCSVDEAAAGQERCNGVDDDCDGAIDEGYALGAPCAAGEGLCARPGQTICADNGLLGCDAEPGPAADETCDGRDEDCDGDIDEDFVARGLGGACSVGRGVCRVDGEGVCAADGAGIECDAVPGPPAGEELCNDLDEDCDGVIDEGFPGLDEPCAVGRGTCAAEGRNVCADSGLDVICDAEPLPPGRELCNGRDDDCDGGPDEDFFDIGVPCQVGTGACLVFGEQVCAADGDGTTCDAVPDEPRVERCDNVDDDCDGRIDEDFFDDCGLRVGQLSAGGYHTCGIGRDDLPHCFGQIDDPPATTLGVFFAGPDWHCGLTVEGAEIRCWGDGPPALFEPPPGTFEALALGTEHGCALDRDGVVTCWGVDRDGETTPPPGVLFEAIAAGPAVTCGVDTEGGLRCWGGDENGRASPPAGQYAAVTVGSEHGCALTAGAGEIICWGAARNGLQDPPAGGFALIDAGDFHTCAATEEGALSCWGAGGADQGPAFPHFGQSAPPDDLPPVQWLTAGGLHTCVIDAADRPHCWGAGSPAFAPDGFFHVGQATLP